MHDPEFWFEVIEEVDIFNFNTPDNEIFEFELLFNPNK